MSRTQLWAGLDVGADNSVLCTTDDKGNVILEQSVATKASALHGILRREKRRIKLIALEAGAYGVAITRSLRKLGYPVAVFDSRQASKFLAIRQNKTDRNDARGLADIARLGRGSVAEVRVKSPECQRLKSTLVIRQRLVQLRMATESTMRSLFRINGGRLRTSSSAAALRRDVHNELRRLRKHEKVDLTEDVQPLLTVSQAIRTCLETLDNQLASKAAEIPVCRRFLEITGVGPLCALSFYSAIGEPTRFRRNADVGAYLGMVPKIRQTGQTTVRLRISKMGDVMTRAYLSNAGLLHLRFGKSALSAWGTSLAARSGKRRAQTAVARKLAVLMLSMWKSGERFNPRHGLGPIQDSADDREISIVN